MENLEWKKNLVYKDIIAARFPSQPQQQTGGETQNYRSVHSSDN